MAPLTELFGFPPSGSISPSVRLLEKDFSAYDPGTSFSRAALVGFSSKGPINEPTRVFNHEDLFRKFGFPDPTTDHGSYLVYAANEFLKFGSEAWILRVGVTDEADWDNFAKTAFVEVPASGTSAIIRTLKDGTDFVDIIENVNDKFRFSVNGSLFKKTIQIPAGEYTLIDDISSDQNLVDAFNEIFTDGDGIEAFVTNGTLGFRTTKRFGSNASIELISVEDDIYSTIEIGEAMTEATLEGANTQWPLGSSVTGFYFGDSVDPTLRIRVNGTSNSSIDNIIQTIPFEDLTHAADSTTVNTIGLEGPTVSASDIVDYINWYIDNPASHTATVPGGFRAKLDTGGTKVVLYTSKLHLDGSSLPIDFDGDSSDGIHEIKGKDALVQARFDSQDVDEILGFSNNAALGSTDELSASTTLVSGTADSDTGLFIDDIGKATGADFAAGTAPTLMTIWADSPGLAGNNTQVSISINEEGEIDLTVLNNTTFVESHGGLNLDFTSTNNPFYIEQWINGFSNYIFIDHNTDVSGHPLEGTFNLGATSGTQGSDGYPFDDDGLPDPDAIDQLVQGNIQLGTGLNAIAEPERIDIDLIAVPGLNSTAIMDATIELCEITRRDCMAVLDTPVGLDSLSVRKWHNGDHPLNSRRLDTSYAALYWPWVKVRDPFNAVDVWIPPTGPILGVYANSERIENAWAAPAGLRRGGIPTIKEVETFAYIKERDALYGNRNAVNVIVPFPIDGPTVWGQKTLQRRATALDRVNVRRLMLYLEKVIKERSRFLLFEPHDELLRAEFVRIASNVLDVVKEGRGVADYIIKCDEELNPPEVIDRNELRARIGVQPTKVAEFIFIEFTIHRTGSFEESIF